MSINHFKINLNDKIYWLSIKNLLFYLTGSSSRYWFNLKSRLTAIYELNQ